MKFCTVLIATSIIAMGLSAFSSQTPSKAEVKRMISAAHTPDDFERLGTYFDQRSAEFERKAEQQQKELDRLLALPFHARSYPTQVDHTRDLISRYKAQAGAAAAEALKYHNRAKEANGTTAQGRQGP